jgi:DNA-binding MarR family transcriptional regulator
MMQRVMMSRVTASPESVVTEWRDLLDRHARATCALEHALKSHDLGVSEYEVLDRLASGKQKEQRRMQTLGEAVHLSQSALSRVVGRLEADGLVVRGMCAEDRRGIFVCITDEGRARLKEARPSYRAALSESLGG